MPFNINNIKPRLGILASVRQAWAGSLQFTLGIVQDTLDRIRDQINAFDTRISSLEAKTAIGGVFVKNFFVTAALTIPLPAEAIGSVLLYILRSDGAGDHVITWPTEFKGLYTPVTLQSGKTSSSMVTRISPTEFHPVLVAIENVTIT